MIRLAFLRAAVAFVTALALYHPNTALAGQHTWNVNEVFSNADGTVQYIELVEGNGTPGENGVGNGQNFSSLTQNFTMTGGPVVGDTSNKFYLIATAGYAAQAGSPIPDEIIPGGNVPFFNTAGDTVCFNPYDCWVFGAVPTDGLRSLDRTTGVGFATPTNFAGATAIPVMPARGIQALIALLLTSLVMAGFRLRRASC